MRQGYRTARSFVACGALAVGAMLFSACGGGGGSPATGGRTLTGSASVSTSATSRIARQSVGQLGNIQRALRPTRFSAQNRGLARGRQAIEYDPELGLYYRVAMNRDGARAEFYRDSGGRQKVGEFIYAERPGSYEIIANLQGEFEMYCKLAETSSPDRIKLRARYVDLQTQERSSIDGEVVVGPISGGRQYDDDDPYDWEDEFDWGEWGGDDTDWYDDFDWWNDSNDYYFGDDYDFDTGDYFDDQDFFYWNDDEYDYQPGYDYNEDYDDIGDFEIVRFEGAIEYAGCGRTVRIYEATLDYNTGRLQGNIQVDGASGSVDYNVETGQGQIVLNSSQGQVRILFRGDDVEAIYPDGRREQVKLSQWADPCAGSDEDGDSDGDTPPTRFAVSSTSFQNNGVIPREHASSEIGGQNRSPALSWSGAPQGTRSFVLICLDPDADNFIHWVVYDIPASVNSLAAGVPAQPTLSNGAKQGKNDMGTIGYYGPEPPPNEEHRYVFIVHALSVESLNLPAEASYNEVSQAMQGKILAEAQIIGKFVR